MLAIIFNYLIVFLIFMLLFLLSTFEKHFILKSKVKIIFVIMLVFSIFAGYRVIGTDTNSYRIIFDEQPIMLMSKEFLQVMFQSHIEPGFVLLISYLKYYGFGFNVFLFISALVPILVIFYTIIRNEKKYIFLTTFLFFLLYAVRGPLDVIRHFFAAAIFLSALSSLAIKKEYLFWGKAVISYFFHYSSILIMVIRPILKIKWKLKVYILFGVGLILLGLTIGNFITEFLHDLDLVSTDRILYKIQNYIDNTYEVASFSQGLILYVMWYLPIALNIGIILVALSKRKRFYKNEFLTLVLNSLIIGNLIFIFLSSMGAVIMARRIEFMLSIGNAFLLKEIVVNWKGKNRYKFIFIILILLLYALFQFMYLIQLRTNLF